MAMTFGIGHGLAQVLHDDVEDLVRVVDDDVLLAHGGEAIAVELADALGEADDERLEQQIGAVADDELGGVGERQQAVLDEDAVLADLQLLDDELLAAGRASPLRVRGGSRGRGGGASAPSRTSATRSSASSWISMSLSRSTRKAPWLLIVKAGEQLGDEQADDGLEPDEAQLRVLGVGAAEADEALELAGNRNERRSCACRRSRAASRRRASAPC